MKQSEILEIEQRIARLFAGARLKKGGLQGWTARTSNGRDTTYEIRGLRDLTELEDTIANLFVWVWSYRDHLVEHLSFTEQERDTFFAEINQLAVFQIVADVANLLKHGKVSRPKTHHRPRLGRAQISFGKEALQALICWGDHFRIDIGDPERVEFALPVLDHAGSTLVDAFVLLESAISEWEQRKQRARANG